jgi:hypothetical protein
VIASFEVVFAALDERPPALLDRVEPPRHLITGRRPETADAGAKWLLTRSAREASASIVADVTTTFRSGGAAASGAGSRAGSRC